MALKQIEEAVRTLQLRVGEIFEQLGIAAPVGKVDAYAGATAPAGWLLCDGSAVSRSAYPRLFALVGVTYGPGNGSTTFNLPDARGRVLVARDAAQSEFDALGETGGAKTHTLTQGEMPAHRHSISFGTGGASSGSRIAFAPSTNAVGSDPGPVATTGSNQPHNNLQPYLTVNYIIRAA